MKIRGLRDKRRNNKRKELYRRKAAARRASGTCAGCGKLPCICVESKRVRPGSVHSAPVDSQAFGQGPAEIGPGDSNR